MQAPVTVLQSNTKRDVGKKAQSGNIMAAKVAGRPTSCSWKPCLGSQHFSQLRVIQAVADIVRTTLGPRSMLKMLLDAGGGQLFPASWALYK